MPIVNPFEGTKKVAFSFITSRTNNIVVVDNNFSNTLEVFNKHNTIRKDIVKFLFIVQRE